VGALDQAPDAAAEGAAVVCMQRRNIEQGPAHACISLIGVAGVILVQACIILGLSLALGTLLNSAFLTKQGGVCAIVDLLDARATSIADCSRRHCMCSSSSSSTCAA
jgi:hypothetical protein